MIPLALTAWLSTNAAIAIALITHYRSEIRANS